jgi:hypothetical protein
MPSKRHKSIFGKRRDQRMQVLCKREIETHFFQHWHKKSPQKRASKYKPSNPNSNYL